MVVSVSTHGGKNKLYSAMAERTLALETKDWVQVLDLSLSEDVVLSE